jgi:hypothetical protein
MGELTSEERAFLEGLLQEVNKAEQMVRNNVKTETVKEMIQRIERKAEIKIKGLEQAQTVQFRKEKIAKNDINLPTKAIQPSLFRAALNCVCFAGAATVPSELSWKLDLMCSALNEALNSSSKS